MDDDEVDRRIVRRALLAEEGAFQVTEAEDAAQAKALLASHRFDLILLDYLLPDADGHELLATFRESGIFTPVIVLTGHGTEAVAVKMMKAGACDYLPKNGITPRVILQTVKSALAPPPATPPLPDGMSQTAVSWTPGAKVAARYRLVRALGHGAYARVFLSEDEVLNRRVVIKVIHETLLNSDHLTERFLEEARVVAAIDHPNVIRIFDIGYAHGLPYLIIEYAENGSLADHLSSNGRLTFTQASPIFDQILQGLGHVHSLGFLHRDIKPANVLLTKGPTAKLSDFGLAVAMNVRQEEPPVSPDRTMEVRGEAPLAGSPAYMSPEAIMGAPLSPASDLYSVAAVLYEVLTGHPYLDLEGLTLPEIRRAICHDEPLPPAAPLGPFEPIILKGLAKDSRKRYRTAEEMRQALANIGD